MVTVKRSLSEISSSTETVVNSTNSFSDQGNDHKPVKKRKMAKVKEVKTESPGKYQKRTWTAEEDKIFLEIIEKVCATGIWQEIKIDGRLTYRGQSGIRAHYLALFKNLKKGTLSGE